MDKSEPNEAGDNNNTSHSDVKPAKPHLLSDLNYDVIYHICSYLQLMDLIACQFLTKQFWEAVTKIFERKYHHLRLESETFTDPYQEQLISRNDKVNIVTSVLQRVGGWVTALTVAPACHFEDLNEVIAENCPQLIELNLCGNIRRIPLPMGLIVPLNKVQALKMSNWSALDEKTDDSIIKFNIDSCPNLERLTLTGMRIWRLNIFCGNRLKELSLNMVEQGFPTKPHANKDPLNRDDMETNTFSKLEVLRLHQCSHVFQILPQLMTNSANLKHLVMATNKSDLARLCQSLSHLEHFDIALDVSDAEIMEIGKLKYLKKLHIFFRQRSTRYCHNDHWINKLIQSLANRNVLEEFRLSVTNDTIQFTMDTIDACRTFTQLKVLTVQKGIFSGTDSLLSMCSAMDCLERLQINYKQAELSSLEGLIQNMPNLLSLRVTSKSDCHHLTSKKSQPMLVINYIDPAN